MVAAVVHDGQDDTPDNNDDNDDDDDDDDHAGDDDDDDDDDGGDDDNDGQVKKIWITGVDRSWLLVAVTSGATAEGAAAAASCKCRGGVL